MRRVLQHQPLAAGAVVEHQRELAPVRLVRDARVLREQPRGVARHAVLEVELERPEVVREQRDALLRHLGPHRVDRLVIGREARELAQQAVDLLRAPIGALFGRHRIEALPIGQGAVRRVAGEQLVQGGRSGARPADDEDRLGEGRREDLGPRAKRLLDAQVRAREAQGVVARGEAADEVERRVALERRAQGVERLDRRGRRLRFVAQLLPRLGPERPRIEAPRARQRTPGSVQRADPARAPLARAAEGPDPRRCARHRHHVNPPCRSIV